MNNEIKEISLSELLDTVLTINENGEMVGYFTLKKINMIANILTNLQEENERLNNIINELEKYIETEINFQKIIDRHYELRKVLIKLTELKKKK